MATAGATVAAMQSELFSGITKVLLSAPADNVMATSSASSSAPQMEMVATGLSLAVLASAVFSRWFHPVAEKRPAGNNVAKAGPAALSGMLFAHGLRMSGMLQSSKVVGFFYVAGTWDPSLAFVMMGGLLVSGLSYQLVFRGATARPLALTPSSANLKNDCDCDAKFQIPTSTAIDRNLVAGAAFFGLGWGIAGICLGPGLFLASTGIPAVLQWWFPSFLVGSALAKQLK